MTKKIVQNLRNIAQATNELADNLEQSPFERLFDLESIMPASKLEQYRQKAQEAERKPLLDPEIIKENEYWHTVGKSGRTLTHSLNKVLKDWSYGSLRTPMNERAIVEVAIDCRLDATELATKITKHERFGSTALKDYAEKLINQ